MGVCHFPLFVLSVVMEGVYLSKFYIYVGFSMFCPTFSPMYERGLVVYVQVLVLAVFRGSGFFVCRRRILGKGAVMNDSSIFPYYGTNGIVVLGLCLISVGGSVRVGVGSFKGLLGFQ